MSVYLDLLPPPQFDRSLVAYAVGNFQRIRDAFVRVSGRTYVFSVASAGAWPKSFTVTHPFRADVLATFGATCWAAAVGVAGLAMAVDGSFVGTWGTYFFNEASSHKTCTGVFVGRSMAAGDHVWQISLPIGNTLSDGNDQGYIAFTMTEV